MSQATKAAEVLANAGSAKSDKAQDERLAFRGVFARLLVRPEIGAIMAAVAIWVFFWAVTEKFGQATGAASVLDTASSPLGIMAVAVALLMIGGEFDLSSGAATGALGILIALLVRDVTGEMGGAGLSLWLALPITLAIALGLGWFNGTLVNRTSLPSFIVTLGSFFILKGAKLGYAKLLVDQIQVGKLDDLAITAEAEGVSDRGYGFFNNLFAAEWVRNDHIWDGRDTFYTVLCTAGLALVLLALFELSFLRREKANPTGLIAFAVGVAIAVAGTLFLHNTDGNTNNTVGAAIIGAGMVVAAYGLGLWRYEPIAERGSFSPDSGVIQAAGAGIVALVLAAVAAISLDAQADERILFQFTEQGIRAILFAVFATAGFVFLLVAVGRAKQISQTTRSAMLALTALAVAAMAFFIQNQSASPKFRAQAFSVLLLLAAIMFVWALVGLFFTERRKADAAADSLGGRVAIAGGLLFAIGLAIRLLFIVPAEAELPGRVVFSVRTLWFLLFTAVVSWVLARTRFGSWTFAVGGNKQAARQVGVPADRTKIQLFMVVSFAAWLVGSLLAFRLNTIQASTGDGQEFIYIIAAVVGGTALTGGYGSTIGAAVGAFIWAMIVQGIPFALWNSDWRFVFLGGILLLSVIANNFIRARAEASR